MPARPSKRPKRPRDVNQLATQIVRITTEQEADQPPAEKPKNPAAVALSKLGASKGGKTRAEKLSAVKRKAIAKKAAASRWNKKG